jgi:hypothetical protein
MVERQHKFEDGHDSQNETSAYPYKKETQFSPCHIANGTPVNRLPLNNRLSFPDSNSSQIRSISGGVYSA